MGAPFVSFAPLCPALSSPLSSHPSPLLSLLSSSITVAASRPSQIGSDGDSFTLFIDELARSITQLNEERKRLGDVLESTSIDSSRLRNSLQTNPGMVGVWGGGGGGGGRECV